MFLRVARWVPLSGILFAALVVIAVLIKSAPGADATDAEVVSYYADDGHLREEAVAFLLIALAGLFFLWFLGSLRGALARAEGEPARLTTATIAAGVAFITLAVAGHATRAATAGAVDAYGETFQVDPNTARVVLALGSTLFVGAFFAGAGMALAASVLALQTGVLPRWLAVLGLLGALGGLLGFLFWPALLLFAWIVAVSAYLLWAARAVEREPAGEARTTPL